MIDCGISVEMTALTKGRRRPNSGELARLILENGKPVWAPQSFCPNDNAERGGGWLQFTRVVGTRLEYQILDRHEHHVEGDMAIWEGRSGGHGGPEGGVSTLVRWHHGQGRAAITVWLEAGDLGQDPNPAAGLIPPLRSFWSQRQDPPRRTPGRLPGEVSTGMPGVPYFAERLIRGEALGPKVVGMGLDWSLTTMKRERLEAGMVVTKGARAWLFKPGNETRPGDALGVI